MFVGACVVGGGQAHETKVHVEFVAASREAFRQFVGRLCTGVSLLLEVNTPERVPHKFGWETGDASR